MKTELPQEFLERLERIVPSERLAEILESFSFSGRVTCRVNPLRVSRNQMFQHLKDRGMAFYEVDWYEDAFVLEDAELFSEICQEAIQSGFIYQQSLSSMLVPLILNPQPGDAVLDLCAAPGSKTSQIAALMSNEGRILAVEPIRKRYFKLKSVLMSLGVTMADVKSIDGRRYRERVGYDRVLVDAPCSSEGRFCLETPKSYAYWSKRKIKEMAHKQKGLLWNGLRQLKVGGVLVYSTCTFAPEENEEVVHWVLNKTSAVTLEDFVLPPERRFSLSVPESRPSRVAIHAVPGLRTWEHKAYDSRLKQAKRILPLAGMDAFFVAKFRKTGVIE